MATAKPFENRRFSLSGGHHSNFWMELIGQALQFVGLNTISRPLPSLSVFDIGCYMWHCSPATLMFERVIETCLVLRSPYRGCSRLPTLAPVVNANVRITRLRILPFSLRLLARDSLNIFWIWPHSKAQYSFLGFSFGALFNVYCASLYLSNLVCANPKYLRSFFVSPK